MLKRLILLNVILKKSIQWPGLFPLHNYLILLKLIKLS